MKTVCLGCREGKVVPGCARGRGDRGGEALRTEAAVGSCRRGLSAWRN